MSEQLRIIGCGVMGSAIALRLIEEKQAPIFSLHDRLTPRAEELAKELQKKRRVCFLEEATPFIAKQPLEDMKQGEGILLAVKPQDFPQVSQDLSGFKGLIISLLTGVSLSQLREAFPEASLVRMMPNLAVRYGKGVIALVQDSWHSYEKEILERLFLPLGTLHWIAETQFDAVTALTGSGPAVICLLVEAMVDAAIAIGLSAEIGYQMVQQMMAGTLALLGESYPEKARWQICSPAGTTIAALRALEQAGARSALIEAFYAAYSRAQQLGKKPENS